MKKKLTPILALLVLVAAAFFGIPMGDKAPVSTLPTEQILLETPDTMPAESISEDADILIPE